MNSPRAKFTMPVMPKVSVMPSAMMPYMAPMMAPFSTWPRTSWVTVSGLLRSHRAERPVHDEPCAELRPPSEPPPKQGCAGKAGARTAAITLHGVLSDRPLARIDVSDLEGAALLEPHHIEVEDRLAALVEADLPEPVVGHRHQRLPDGHGIVDGAGLLHRLDEHVDVVVAGGRAEGSLVVREVPLVEILVGLDELGHLGILLLG